MANTTDITHAGVTYSVTTPAIPASTHVETCPGCDGTGRLYSRTCKGCDGRGVVTLAGAANLAEATGDSSADKSKGRG
jgi:DnaJ-class molecular chaperone